MDAKQESILKWILRVLMGGWVLYVIVAIYIKYALSKYIMGTFIVFPPSLVVAIAWTIILVLIGGVLGYIIDLRKQEPPTQSYIS